MRAYICCIWGKLSVVNIKALVQSSPGRNDNIRVIQQELVFTCACVRAGMRVSMRVYVRAKYHGRRKYRTVFNSSGSFIMT